MALAYSVRRKQLAAPAPARPTVDDYIQRLHNMYISQYLRTDSRPAKIVEGLFLGSVGAAYNHTSLKVRKVTHILTMCDCLPPKFPSEFRYKVVEILDEPSAKLSAHFKDTGEFIHSAIEGGGVVLVHCFAGVSRSASTVIAYLMRYHNMTFNQAFAHVKSKRPWINPNNGFLNQLRRYETWLNEQRKNGTLN